MRFLLLLFCINVNFAFGQQLTLSKENAQILANNPITINVHVAPHKTKEDVLNDEYVKGLLRAYKDFYDYDYIVNVHEDSGIENCSVNNEEIIRIFHYVERKMMVSNQKVMIKTFTVFRLNIYGENVFLAKIQAGKNDEPNYEKLLSMLSKRISKKAKR